MQKLILAESVLSFAISFLFLNDIFQRGDDNRIIQMDSLSLKLVFYIVKTVIKCYIHAKLVLEDTFEIESFLHLI